MSTRQVLRQLEYTITNLAWPTSGDSVFHDVVITTLGWEFFLDSDLRKPYLIITPVGSQSELENPQLKKLSLEITIVAIHEGDSKGRAAAIGGHGSWSQTNSKQKGLFELQEKLWDTIEKEGRDRGIIYMLGGRSEQVLSGIGNNEESVIAILKISLEVMIFEKSTYTNPAKFLATKSGSDAVLTWNDHPDRYDRISSGGIIVARVSGSSNPTIANQIATVDVGVGTYTDSAPGAGTWTYGLFAQYDEINDPPSSSTNNSPGIFYTVTI